MGKYDDIISLEHPVSKNHQKMTNYNRAAQFAPFAALVGYAEAIEESKEIYEPRIEISDDKKEEIGNVLSSLRSGNIVEVTYFVRMKNKDLGKYIDYSGVVKKIGYIESKIIFTNRKSIYIKDIYNIIVKDE